MRKYLVALMTGVVLLGGPPAVFGEERVPASIQEKRMQEDYNQRKAERKAYRKEYKKEQKEIKAKHEAHLKKKEAKKKENSK